MRLHSLRTDPMTLDEARRIQANFDRGVLDPDLPGTMELVNEARRRSGGTQLWRNQPTTHYARPTRFYVAVCCATVALTAFVLALSFFTITQ